jgi:ATP-dependent exoDNAse (exonuclease V) beta subunit
MHKVKGLEFDAVIVTPSFASLPFDGRDNPDIDFDSPLTAEEREELEEERRLQYVAYTRARKRLSVYRFNRELHLDKMQKIRRQDARLGWNDKAGIDKYFLSFLATDWYFKNNAYVEKYLGKNEPLTIEPHSSGDKYQIKHNGTVIGQLSRNSEILRKAQNNRESGMKLPNLSGIFVSEVYVWTWEDTLKYDELHDTNFQKFWGEPARRKGYIYIVDFAGYAK